MAQKITLVGWPKLSKIPLLLCSLTTACLLRLVAEAPLAARSAQPGPALSHLNGVKRTNGVQAAIDALVCGPADQHLAPDWEAHDCLCQAHQLTVILNLARDVVHLQSGSSATRLYFCQALLHELDSPEVQNSTVTQGPRGGGPPRAPGAGRGGGGE